MTATARERINEARWQCFLHLRENGGTSTASVDAFEAFLRSPGTLDAPSLIIRCRFSEGSVNCHVVVDKPKSRWRLSTQFMPFLERLRHRLQGTADVLILVSDTMYVAEERKAECVEFLKQAPLLRCDWRDDDPISSHAIPIPDFTLMDAEYATDVAEIDKAATSTSFADRKDVIKWRGRLTGPGFPDIHNRHLFPRYHLLHLAASRPDILDARLTHPDNFARTSAGEALLRHVRDSLGGTSPEIAPAEFVAYKYLISLDGVVATWKRVANSLRTGSVLFLPIRWKQFFYPGLVAGEHYVPVALDLSDLFERYAWLQDRPDEAERIGRAGRCFAEEVISIQAVDDYFVAVIDACATLLHVDR
ncbi:glycosyl transferase family 90 [Solilutibacter silvestris]|uniref:Glycosyl transferase family 90 n=1 Tax=Solilutibacter silvestris TaxID=1645665 RepID=A0A2K1PX05_9GAMM|nr:glycosyl transferase family 90 [Lysobacter silvestris]PNS07326.1 Glycosyl transferase family 90 [Lysobacter silvestris]